LKRAGFTAALLICLAGRPAHASGHALNAVGDAFAPFLVLGVVIALAIPSDIGAVIPAHDAGNPTFALGWSWQIPLPPMVDGHLYFSHHRLIGGFDYRPDGGDVNFRGRFGYRYWRGYLFGGLAGAVDHTGWSWSPEIGVKFLPWQGKIDEPGPCWHLLVRADVAPDLDAFRAVTAFFGWSFI
jgi:hypothetical protein